MNDPARVATVAVALCLGAGCGDDSPQQPTQGDLNAVGGSGGEAAANGYSKGTGAPWDGSAGNPYGYPQEQTPTVDCGGFGFNSSITGLFYESCLIKCGDAGSCPMVDGGPAPSCDAVPMAAGQLACVLPCPNDAPCPEGMSCIPMAQVGPVCLWPKQYGTKPADR